MALGAVIASTGIAVAGSGPAPPTATKSAVTNLSQVTFAQVKGDPIGGLVAAGRLPRERRASIYISLHGLPPIQGDSDRYLVTADRRPCSQVAGDADLDGSVDGADYLVWRVGIIVADTEGDFHVRAHPRAGLDAAKSVRIYDWPGPLVQKACGPTVS